MTFSRRENAGRRQMRQMMSLALAAAISGLLAFGDAASAQTPRHGGTLTVGFPSDSKTFDPTFSVEVTERQALYLVFNTLVQYAPDFSIRPELAESWSVENDGRRVVFRLRQ